MNIPNKLARDIQIAILDIGSNKSACFIADILAGNKVEVLGIGHMLSKGLRSATITDATEAETSIITTVNAAEEMTTTHVEKVMVSINMPKIKSRQLAIDIELGGKQISERDLQDIFSDAANTAANDETILHILPFRFELDDQKSLRDPRGMVGNKLTANILIVTVPDNLLLNLKHCLGRCHLEAEEYVCAAYASALACLEEDEKNLGTTLIDMGAFTTSYAVFLDGRMIDTGSIGIGSHHITQDIAQGLNTSIQNAERLKTIHGNAIISPADDTVMIEVYPIGSDNEEEASLEKRSNLNHIIKPRVEEIFELTREALNKTNLGSKASNRIVLTGGGSQLLGISEIASKMFDTQVRLASPKRVEGLADSTSGPAFSTAIGMLEYAKLANGKQSWMHQKHGKFSGRSFGQIIRWFKENF